MYCLVTRSFVIAVVVRRLVIRDLSHSRDVIVVLRLRLLSLWLGDHGLGDVLKQRRIDATVGIRVVRQGPS